MNNFIAALALLVAAGLAASAQQSNVSPDDRDIGMCLPPPSRDYFKTTIRVEIKGILTHMPASSGCFPPEPETVPLLTDSTSIAFIPAITEIRANGKTFLLDFDGADHLSFLAGKLSGKRVIVTGILNGTTVQVTGMHEDDSVYIMIDPSPSREHVKETTEVEARGQLQVVVRLVGGEKSEFAESPHEITHEFHFVVNGKNYNLQFTPALRELAEKLNGKDVLVTGVLNKDTITVKSLKVAE